MGTVYSRPLWSAPLPKLSSLVSLPRVSIAAPNLLSPSPSPSALSLALPSTPQLPNTLLVLVALRFESYQSYSP